jgi:poly(hydroxyalkanoate) depolymerase family esterase
MLDGMGLETRTYLGPEGTRTYRLYVPAMPPSEPRSLVVMLHGCGQGPEEFAHATRMSAQAEEHGLIVAYPEQTSAHHARGCWNWYRPGDQRRGAGEPAIIAGLTLDLMSEFAVTSDRVFVAGLSAGGAMAAVLGATYPDLYAAVGVHSGVPCGSAVDVVTALGAMRWGAGWTTTMFRSARDQGPVRTIVFHGTADGTVNPANAGRIVTAATGGLTHDLCDERGTVDGGHSYLVTLATGADGAALSELWLIAGCGHAWSGGSAEARFTDPAGPDASAEMVRFFLQSASATGTSTPTEG